MKHNAILMHIGTLCIFFAFSCYGQESKRKVPSLRFKAAHSIAKKLIDLKANFGSPEAYKEEISKQTQQLPEELKDYVYLLGRYDLHLDKALWHTLIYSPHRIDILNDLTIAHVAVINTIAPESLSQFAFFSKIRNQTPLIYSVDNGLLDVVKLLLDNGANREQEVNGNSPLAVAIIKNEPAITELLLKHGADPNHICHHMTPLTLAALSSLKTIYTVDTPTYDAYALLDLIKTLPTYVDALIASDRETITLIMNAPQDIEQLNEDISPLNVQFISERTSFGDLDILELLFAYKADPNLKDTIGWTPLMYISQFDSLELVKFFVAHKAAVNVKNPDGQTPLILATQLDRIAIIQFLINHKADVSAEDSKGSTALLWATLNGPETTVKTLLNHGADINHQDTKGYSSLMHAAIQGFTSIVNILIENKATLNLQNSTGQTALMLAALNGEVDCVKLLVNARAAINMQDHAGKTALLLALQEPIYVIDDLRTKLGLEHMVRAQAFEMFDEEATAHFDRSRHIAEVIASILLDHGAQASIPDDDGVIPLILAAEDDLPLIVTRLLNNGASIDHTNQRNVTALIAASFFGHTDSVRILLAHGANKNIIDADGKTALDYARDYGHEDTVKLLSE